mmetsp:Transcript_36798/g.82472  ORF Transcript_36798/g.82472 Transcript_36798/m.82472 type:complete len:281 (-) Transcript_36798:347-1189(-)
MDVFSLAVEGQLGALKLGLESITHRKSVLQVSLVALAPVLRGSQQPAISGGVFLGQGQPSLEAASRLRHRRGHRLARADRAGPPLLGRFQALETRQLLLKASDLGLELCHRPPLIPCGLPRRRLGRRRLLRRPLSPTGRVLPGLGDLDLKLGLAGPAARPLKPLRIDRSPGRRQLRGRRRELRLQDHLPRRPLVGHQAAGGGRARQARLKVEESALPNRHPAAAPGHQTNSGVRSGARSGASSGVSSGAGRRGGLQGVEEAVGFGTAHVPLDSSSLERRP